MSWAKGVEIETAGGPISGSAEQGAGPLPATALRPTSYKMIAGHRIKVPNSRALAYSLLERSSQLALGLKPFPLHRSHEYNASPHLQSHFVGRLIELRRQSLSFEAARPQRRILLGTTLWRWLVQATNIATVDALGKSNLSRPISSRALE